MGNRNFSGKISQVAILASAFALLVAAVSPEADAESETLMAEPALPDAPGRDLVLASCTECHDIKRVAEQRLSRDEWDEMVVRMLDEGAFILPEEQVQIVDYLAFAFGPETPGASAADEPVTEEDQPIADDTPELDGETEATESDEHAQHHQDHDPAAEPDNAHDTNEMGNPE